MRCVALLFSAGFFLLLLHDGTKTTRGGHGPRGFCLGPNPGEIGSRIVVGTSQLGFSVVVDHGGVVGTQHNQGANPVLLLQRLVKYILQPPTAGDVLVRNTRPGYNNSGCLWKEGDKKKKGVVVRYNNRGTIRYIDVLCLPIILRTHRLGESVVLGFGHFRQTDKQKFNVIAGDQNVLVNGLHLGNMKGPSQPVGFLAKQQDELFPGQVVFCVIDCLQCFVGI